MVRTAHRVHPSQGATTLGSTPLIVLTAAQDQSPGWPAAQDKLATLSANSAHRTVHGATHIELLVDRQFAAESCRAITDVVAAARHHTKLGAS